MFYSKFMFVKKGPLSKVWIAAHFHRKLTKPVVQGTDINLSAKSISDPSTPLALRLSGQLLLGLVRIYQKKVRYLQEDASDALTKMKMVLRPGAVDLPPEAATAPVAQITHADNYESIEFAIPDIPLDGGLDDMMMEMPVEGLADSSINAPNLASISADADDITMEDPGLGIDLTTIDLLGEDFTNDVLAPFGEEALLEDDSTLLSDVEAGRNASKSALGGDFGFELGDEPLLDEEALKEAAGDRSALGAEDMSAFDTTTDFEAEGGFQTDITSDAFVPEPMPAPKPRPSRKRKQIKRDTNTELSSKFISDSLKDRSDIVLADGQPLLSKRARVGETTITALLQCPMGLSSLATGTLDFGLGEELALAPELAGLMTLGKDLERDEQVEEEQEEAKFDEVDGALLADDELLQGEQQFDFEGMDHSVMDDSTTALSKSVAPTPEKGAGGEEGTEEPQYADDVEYERQQLEDYFGENSQKSKRKGKGKDVEEDEETGWSQRTKKMQQILSREMKNKKSIGLSKLVENKSRKVAAGVFYQLLILKSHSVVEVEQPKPFADITISNLQLQATR